MYETKHEVLRNVQPYAHIVILQSGIRGYKRRSNINVLFGMKIFFRTRKRSIVHKRPSNLQLNYYQNFKGTLGSHGIVGTMLHRPVIYSKVEILYYDTLYNTIYIGRICFIYPIGIQLSQKLN